MPRFGSVWDESVLRVPKETSFAIDASTFAGSISFSIFLTSSGGS